VEIPKNGKQGGVRVFGIPSQARLSHATLALQWQITRIKVSVRRSLNDAEFAAEETKTQGDAKGHKSHLAALPVSAFPPSALRTSEARPAASDSRGMCHLEEDESRQPTRARAGEQHRWLALGLAWSAQAAGAAVFLALPAIAPRFAERYGMGLQALGVAFAAMMLGAGVSVVPWGSLADRVGERRVMIAGLALAAAALALAAVASSRALVLACLLIAGVGGASASAASSRTVMTWFAPGERGLAMGIRQTALPIGGAVSALVLPHLVTVWSVPGAIASLGALCALTAVALGIAMKDRDKGAVEGEPGHGWRDPLRVPPLRRVIGASGLLAVPQLGLSSFVVVFLHERHHWDVADAAALLAAIQLVGAAVRPLLGRFSDLRQNRTGPLAVAAVVAAGTLLGLAAFSPAGGPGVIVSLVLAGIATLSWNGLAALAAGEYAAHGRTGVALGWQTSAVFIGGAIAGPALAALISATSWQLAFGLLAVPALGAAVLLAPLTGGWRQSSHREDELLGRALASMTAGISLIDVRDPRQPITYINKSFERLTGYPADELLGVSWRLTEGPETDPECARRLHEAIDSGRELRVNIRHHRRDGTPYWSETLMAPVFWPDGSITHYMSVQKDITEKTDAAARAAHMAYHDTLTGLPNRAQLQEHLDLALARAERKDTAVAALFLDLDGFKPVNDTYGHPAGDRLLQDAARRWRTVSRAGEMLARIGGDEFVLILTDLERDSAQAAAAAAGVRCADALLTPFDIHGVPGVTINIDVSVGLALYPRDAATPAELLLAADGAMYAVKRERRAAA